MQEILEDFMKILIRQATIADPKAANNGLVQDILVDGSEISAVANAIDTPADQVIEAQGLLVSPGWVDIFCHSADPGFEHRETLATAAAAAAAGGFTHIFALPDNKPVTDNKSQVEYIRLGSRDLPASILPIGAVTRKMEGTALAEMYDMRNSGAVAFADGLSPVQSPGLLLKALQYVKAFDGVIIQLPVDKSIAGSGLIHEGIISTRLGLPGIPALGEELMIKRDIDLLRYTGSKLHITGVSTEKGLQLIQAAKAEGLQITCSVTPNHLFFCDEDLQDYDTNLKLNPPLRSRADMMALRKAVVNGDVDCISSHHLPQDWDHKTCEFEYAAPGMIGLQTVFPVLQTLLPELDTAALVALLSTNARNIFGLTATHIQQGQVADLTLFSRTGNTVLTKATIRSRSANTAFMDRVLTGQVLGTLHKGRFNHNQNQPT